MLARTASFLLQAIIGVINSLQLSYNPATIVILIPCINDLPNSAEKLSFRIFADDTNIFFTSNNAKEVGFTMNEELELALKYYAINKLAVNLDEHLQWKPQIQHVNNKLAQNVGIIDKLRHYLDLRMLKRL